MKSFAVAALLGLAQAYTPEEQNFVDLMASEEKDILTFETDEQIEEEEDMWENEEDTQELMNEHLTPAQKAKYELQKKEFNEAAKATSDWLQSVDKFGKRVHNMRKRNFMHLKRRMAVWCKQRAIVKKDFDMVAAQVKANFHLDNMPNNHRKMNLTNQKQISDSLNKLKMADRRLKHTIKRDVTRYVKRDQRITKWSQQRWMAKYQPAMEKAEKEWQDFGKSVSNVEDEQELNEATTQLNSAAYGATETVESYPVERVSLQRTIAYSILATFSMAGIIAALFYRPSKKQEKKITVDLESNAPVAKKEIKKTLKSIMKENNAKVTLM